MVNLLSFCYEDAQINTGFPRIDTGSSYILLPKKDYSDLMKMIESSMGSDVIKQQLQDSEEVKYYNCTKRTTKFASIKLVIDNHLLSIEPDQYVVFSHGQCLFRITVSSDNFWILGLPFLS